MKIKNKDIILTNANGQHQRISFESGTNSAHIWYDDINDEIVIDGSVRLVDIDTNSNFVSLEHDKLSNMNDGEFIHLNENEYQQFISLTDGSLITSMHWHEKVNGHKITVNTGQPPSDNSAFDVHIIEEV